MKAFETRVVKVYQGANLYLDRQAFVFDLKVRAREEDVKRLHQEAVQLFPALKGASAKDAAALLARTLVQVLKMDINLHVDRFKVLPEGDLFRIAVDFLDETVTGLCVESVAEWFNAVCEHRAHDFAAEFQWLQQKFDKSMLGGPTLYSLYEAALKRGIPVHYLSEENQFQWGYGRKQIRGRSTTVSVDGIKDTEFTMYKDMVGEFLETRGFPTPKGKTFFREEEVVEEAMKIGWPVVVKPVAGHKGQGVTTNIRSEQEVRRAYKAALDAGEEAADGGIIIQQQIEGTDHRLLTVKGRFVAALQRIPAYVDGNGKDAIGELIAKENDTPARLDNARSPLCKIKIDDDLIDYLDKQNLALNSVPKKGERVFLRRVANISAGGVSINVTDRIHPLNVKLVEDIAVCFNVTCLGVDVLARDISVPWREGDFGIIEINAGPGVFMHLVPAVGKSVDVPGHIMRSHFPKDKSERIPIIAGNALTLDFCGKLLEVGRKARPALTLGSLTEEGIHFNQEYFHKNLRHDENVRILMRHPKLDLAVIRHTAPELKEWGMYHQGADMVILADPKEEEAVLKRDLVPDGYLVTVEPNLVTVERGGEALQKISIGGRGKGAASDAEEALVKAVQPLLPEILDKYGRRHDDPAR
jgi:cyanophycin synthetase